MLAPGERWLLELELVTRVHHAPDGGFTLNVPRLRVAPGEHVVLVGQSGSGKSTLMDMLAFLAEPDSAGRFRFRPTSSEEHDIAELWRQRSRMLGRLRARHIGYVLQTGGLVPYLTVRENLLLSPRLLGQRVRIEPLATSLGLGTMLDRLPAQLSVGQRQRVAVARALAHRPALVLADEPTAALDAALAETAIATLVEATQRVGAALIVVTHDETVAARVGGRRVACLPDPSIRAASVEIEPQRAGSIAA